MNIIFNLLSVLLNSIFKFTGDWGVAIVVLTLVVRLILSPMSFKQKMSIQNQQKLALKMEELKKVYKDNKAKLDEELNKHSSESAKSMLGCLVTLLQLPVLATLWSVINKLPAQAGTSLIPWVASIKLSDSYFIVPTIYMLISLTPSLMQYIPFLKIKGRAEMNKVNIIMMAVISIFVAKAVPVAVGIYLITTSLFSFVEEVAFRLYIRKIKIA